MHQRRVRGSSCRTKWHFNRKAKPTRFLSDLDRWRMAIPSVEQALYDEIVFVLWNKTPQGASPFSPSDNLLYFQQLMQNLISKTGAYGACPGLRETDNLTISPSPESRLPSRVRQTRVVVHEDVRPVYLATWQIHSKEVILLLSTAIFGVVIAFLLGKPRGCELCQTRISPLI